MTESLIVLACICLGTIAAYAGNAVSHKDCSGQSLEQFYRPGNSIPNPSKEFLNPS